MNPHPYENALSKLHNLRDLETNEAKRKLLQEIMLDLQTALDQTESDIGTLPPRFDDDEHENQ
jgi:hypothetical protein